MSQLVPSNLPGRPSETEQAAHILTSWVKARAGNKGLSVMRLKEFPAHAAAELRLPEVRLKILWVVNL